MQAAFGGLIARDGLLRSFDGLSGERVLFVHAPAGFGKSVAVKQWAEGREDAKAFISLDEYDNNLTSFCERFCATLRSCQPQNAALNRLIAQPAFFSAPIEFTMQAIAALSVRRHTLLIIDDLHLLRNEEVLGLLLMLLQKLPGAFQIILISRDNPPSGFLGLWAEGSPAYIGIEQLRFTDDDISQLYERRGNPITLQEAAEIAQFTGGWAIGICALLLSGGKPSGDNLEYLDEFILQNIWNHWDAATREFMLSTSMARQLHPSLCDILAEVSNSERILSALTQRNPFVSQSKDGAFRYHHLFQSFLQHRLKERGSSYIHALIEKEGSWYLARNDFYGAAECFIRCENYGGIARCFDMLEYTDRNEFIIDRMLPIIKAPQTQAAAEQYPSLYYLMAWAAFAEGRDRDMARYMDHYYARYPEIAAANPAFAHNVIYLRLFDYRNSIRGMIAEAAAFPQIPVNGVQGSMTLNMPLFHRGICDFSELALEDIEKYIADVGGRIGWLFGGEWTLIAESLTAGLLHEQGHLEKAYGHALCASTIIQEHFSPELKFCAMSVLACVLDDMNRRSESERILAQISSMIEHNGAYYLTRNFDALTARRRLPGDSKTARDWLSRHKTTLYAGPSVHGIYEAFTTARAHITSGDYDSAIILLTKLHDLARRFGRTLDLIEAQILLAVASRRKKSLQADAMRFLEGAVSAAQPYGYTRLFENEGAELFDMLRQLHKSAIESGGERALSADFIETLCEKTGARNGHGLLYARTEPSIRFTEKQRMVMRLLCEGMSYKEIAQSMKIKLPTLRSHIALIYKKLDVTNESDAVRKIKSFDLA